MCGIVGVFSNTVLSKQDTVKFNHLLEVDVLRGRDGTGVFGVNFKQDVIMYKDCLHIGWVVGDKDYQSTVMGAHKLLVGHNRAATSGDLTKENSHPFYIGDIILVHNGTLHDTSALAGNHTMEVDSQMICNELALAEPDKWKGVLENLDGAFTLVWYDTRIDALRMARNSERPLTIATPKHNKKKAFFASEKLMLEWVLTRGAASVDADYESLPEGQMLEIQYKTGDRTLTPFEPLASWEPSGGWWNYNRPAARGARQFFRLAQHLKRDAGEISFQVFRYDPDVAHGNSSLYIDD